jgi:competence protein ComEC
MGAVWVGVAAGRGGWWWVAGLPVGALAFARGRRWGWLLALPLAAGVIAGGLSGQREAAVLEAGLPGGSVELVATAVTDSRPSRFGGEWWLARPYGVRSGEGWVAWRGPTLLVATDGPAGVMVGAALVVEGELVARAGWAARSPYGGRVNARSLTPIAGGQAPLFTVGNWLRQRVIDRLHGGDPAAALLAGFLVGATDDLPRADYEALRLAGLAHFVAVSGSNVAGFLLLWFLVLGPLALGRRRGLWGLAGLAIFTVATRWEPSVVRASLMAGAVLFGRIVGVPVEPWSALALSGTVAMLVSPELGFNVGFQLSVLATAGILAGSHLFEETLPKWLAVPLGVTVAAQAAVTPLLLGVFGTVPLLAPLTNVVAAPLVAIATAAGGVGVVSGWGPLVAVGALFARLVLEISRLAASGPQLGAVALGLLAAGLLLARRRGWRPVVVLAAALLFAYPLLTALPPPRPGVVFLDVGQGDATLLLGVGGRAVLIDGGPDPVLLAAGLRRYGVRALELVVVTHPHEDHAGGLVGLGDRLPVSRVWHAGPPHTGRGWERFAREMGRAGVAMAVPPVGQVEMIDGIRLQVLGPRRRYAGINDQSVVLLADAGYTRVLLTGDIEEVAQGDLGYVEAEVLKVPHHGAATTDLGWLSRQQPAIAVISVGDNDYGHPSPEVIAALASSVVLRTDEVGDIVLSLTGDPLAGRSLAGSGRSP